MRLPVNTYGTQLVHLLNLLAVCTAILSKVALDELQQVVRTGALNEAKHPRTCACLKTVLYTVELLYRGHHWDPTGCPVYSGTSL